MQVSISNITSDELKKILNNFFKCLFLKFKSRKSSLLERQGMLFKQTKNFPLSGFTRMCLLTDLLYSRLRHNKERRRRKKKQALNKIILSKAVKIGLSFNFKIRNLNLEFKKRLYLFYASIYKKKKSESFFYFVKNFLLVFRFNVSNNLGV